MDFDSASLYPKAKVVNCILGDAMLASLPQIQLLNLNTI